MRTCSAKYICYHDISQSSHSFFYRLRYQNAFPSRKATGFQDNSVTACLHVLDRVINFRRREDSEFRCRY